MATEFSLIDTFLSAFPRSRIQVGPGDDCAVLAPSLKDSCVTTDAVVEGVHFTRRHFSLEQIGHKALAVNLSDLAAMGARPTWFLAALALPPRFSAAELLRLGRGMAALAKSAPISLVGGNLTSAAELSVTLTACGEVFPGKALLRSGARAGDILYVSGTLGEARAGLLQLEQGVKGSALIRRQRQPMPQIKLGLLAADYARAAIDVSDGFCQDLAHLCRASRVGVDVEVESLPVSRALIRFAGGRESALRLALTGGEDYELLLVVPPQRAPAFERACAARGESVSRVGVFLRRNHLRLLSARGRQVPAPVGFDHFR